jgi:hypothetical protein
MRGTNGRVDVDGWVKPGGPVDIHQEVFTGSNQTGEVPNDLKKGGNTN